MSAKKIMRRVEVTRLGKYDLEGTLPELINKLKELELKHPGGIVVYENDYDDSFYYSVYVNRPETDQESQIRRQQEKLRDDAQTARDLQILEHLRKKYG